MERPVETAPADAEQSEETGGERARRSAVPAALEREMDRAIGRYPADRKRSASMPLLHLWQEHFGFISDEGVQWIAAKLELEPINILELVTFYPMYRQKPAGKK
ncbi:MAG TPA: NAD(P)H-dependent oxidoreductase subunit E, partial [Chthoniobacterales bacterium]|nr:NAD(P)H-dependent oxidoreductase subunit E [Chthoniobacterales bacterium]